MIQIYMYMYILSHIITLINKQYYTHNIITFYCDKKV